MLRDGRQRHLPGFWRSRRVRDRASSFHWAWFLFIWGWLLFIQGFMWRCRSEWVTVPPTVPCSRKVGQHAVDGTRQWRSDWRCDKQEPETTLQNHDPPNQPDPGHLCLWSGRAAGATQSRQGQAGLVTAFSPKQKVGEFYTNGKNLALSEWMGKTYIMAWLEMRCRWDHRWLMMGWKWLTGRVEQRQGGWKITGTQQVIRGVDHDRKSPIAPCS